LLRHPPWLADKMTSVIQFQRAFNDSLFIALAAGLSLCLLYAVIRLRSRRVPPATKAMAEAGFLLSTCGVLMVTLLPTPGPGNVIEWVPFSDLSSSARRAQIVANLLLLAPSGFLGVIAFSSLKTRKTLVLFAVITSLSIETAQWLMPLGRVASVEDVLLGTASLLGGGSLGVFAHRLVARDRSTIPAKVEAFRLRQP
jgi:glycopeptide antibiotics resistance protein